MPNCTITIHSPPKAIPRWLTRSLNQPLLHLHPNPPPQPANNLPPNINPPLPSTIHHIPAHPSPCTTTTNPDQQPQTRQRRDRHPHIRLRHIHITTISQPPLPLPPNRRKNSQPPLQHERVRPEQLARDLAVLCPRPAHATACSGPSTATAAPFAAVVVGREEGQVVPRGVVRGEVGGEEEEAGGGREEGGEGGAGAGGGGCGGACGEGCGSCWGW